MKTCEALRSAGFHSVTTIEFRLRNINYTEVQLDVPDFGCKTASASASSSAFSSAAQASQAQPASAAVSTSDGGSTVAGAGGQAEGAVSGGGDVDAGSVGGGDGGEAVVAGTKEASSLSAPAEQDERNASERGIPGGDGSTSNTKVPAMAESGGDSSSSPKDNGTAREPAAAAPESTDTKKRPREEEPDVAVSNAGRGRNERLPSKAAIRATEAAAVSGNGVVQKPPLKLVCAQPFPLMRGHTAFLTFATTPVARQVGAAATATAQGGKGNATAIDVGAKSGDQADSSAGGVNRGGPDLSGGGDMDVCEQEGVDGGKGKDREKDEEGVKNSADVKSADDAAVSGSTHSSSAAGR